MFIYKPTLLPYPITDTMAVSFEAGTWVWCPDEEDLFLPGQVQVTFKRGEPGQAKFADGEEKNITAKESAELLVCDAQSLESIENMVQLNDLNNASILHNLRLRFQQDVIYTSVGAILVSVNPFKLLPIYTPEWLDKYKGGSRGQPPHCYGIADDAYRQMTDKGDNHAVIIAGESGAGKTEAMKLVLQYIAEVSGKRETDGPSLEEQILKANPVMEAFGNAKTTRNNNSSRFGKWTAVKFDASQTIIGGKIINYLLEKSRVVNQSENERNYHIFYQLFAGAEKSKHETDPKKNLKKLFDLGEAQDYLYTNPGGRLEGSKGEGTTVAGINDEREFDDLVGAMRVIGMTPDEVENVLRVVAAILNLGNVSYMPDPAAEGEDKVKISNMEALEKVCSLLQIPTDSLVRCLTSRGIGAHSVIQVSYKLDEATGSRDALAKTIYGNLFDYLIGKINKSLSANTDEASVKSVIGVLDIFGFESFEKNSFEQLCINYCNEKLQFHFNDHIFKLEQEQYKAEGVSVDAITFVDNQAALDLLEKKSVGIISMIDEEIKTPKGDDFKMLAKMNKAYGERGKEHMNYAKPKPRAKDSDKSFIFKHYAGPVCYDVTGFMEKSKDTLHDDIVGVMRIAEDPLMKELFPPPAPAAPSAGRRRGGGKPSSKKTLGTQFKEQLNELMKILNTTTPHFIRCFKPNAEKRGGIFTADMMMQQLQYAGLLEVCRIRQVGFPIRYDFDHFFQRFLCLHPSAKSCDDLVKGLSDQSMLGPNEFAKGTSKYFLRNGQAMDLEVARETALSTVATKIAACCRRFLVRMKQKRHKEILVALEKALTGRNGEELEHWLNQASELPFKGVHLKIVRDSTAALEVIREERRVEKLLQDAIEAREINGLLGAIKTAEEMKMLSATLDNAKSLVSRIQDEAKCKDALAAAVSSRNEAALTSAAAKARELSLVDTAEFKQANALLERIRLENEAVGQLQSAIDSEDMNELQAYLQQMVEMGLDDGARFPQFVSTITSAKKLLASLKAKGSALQALAKACNGTDLAALENALADAAAAGVAAADMAGAKEKHAELTAKAAALAKVSAAINSELLADITAALANAAKVGATGEILSRAKQLKGQLEARQAAVEELNAAVASGDAGKISKMLATAMEAGCSGPCITAAESALSKLGAASQMLGKLASAGNSLSELDAAIAEATAMGGLEDAVVRAQSSRARLVQQAEVEGKINNAIVANNYNALKLAMSDADACGLLSNPLKEEEMSAAQNTLKRFAEIADAVAELNAAIQSRDKRAILLRMQTVSALGLEKGPEVTRAKDLLNVLEEEAKLTANIQDALKTKDPAVLKVLLAEATKAGLDNSAVQAAGMIVNREATITSTINKIKVATEKWDLDLMNACMETCIQLGIEGDEVDAAKVNLDAMKKEAAMASKIQAAANTLLMKSTSKAGITADDIKPLNAAMESALKEGLQADSASFKKFEAMRANAESQIALYDEIAAAIDTADNGGSSIFEKFKMLTATLNKALDLNMDGVATVETLKALHREYDKLVQQARRARNEASDDDEGEEDDDEEEEDEEEVERRRLEAQERAMQPRFKFEKFSRIRSAQDYGKGVWFGKDKIMKTQLIWQQGVIKKSITDLDGKFNKEALKIHKCILGYCGDKSMNFPDMLAQDILKTGVNCSELWDEIYVQICKQLTENPGEESKERCWQLMCMCTGTFPPSAEFKDHLMNFMLSNQSDSGSLAEYQKYSLRRLEGMLEQGPSGYIPLVDEIKAYKDRPPIVVTIELVDGGSLTTDLPITPDLDVKKVGEICNHFLDIEDERTSQFGIFMVVGDESDIAGTTTTPLAGKVYMGDEVAKLRRSGKPYKFVYKRKICLKKFDDKSNCDVFNRLCFLQCVDEIINGTYSDVISTVEDAVNIVATAVFADNADDLEEMGDELDANVLVDDFAMMAYVPHIWHGQLDEDGWSSKVLAKLKTWVTAEADVEEIQDQLVEQSKQDRMYGALIFNCSLISIEENNAPAGMKSLPKLLKVAFDSDGCRFISGEAGASKTYLGQYGYVDICRWGGTSNKFSLQLWNADLDRTFSLMLATNQGAAISNFLLEMIEEIMAHS